MPDREKTVPKTIQEQMDARIRLFHEPFSPEPEQEIQIDSKFTFQSEDGTIYGFYSIHNPKLGRLYTSIKVPVTVANIYYGQDVIVQPATDTGRDYMIKSGTDGIQASTQLKVEELRTDSIYLGYPESHTVYMIDSNGGVTLIK